MSDRDAHYGDSTHGDTFQAPTTGRRGESSSQSERAADQAKAKGQQAMDQATDKGRQVMDQASDRTQQAREKLDQATDVAHERADQGMDKASQGLDQAAEMVRERAPQGGTVGNVASTAADTMESASTYLRDKDSSQLMDDLENFIRRKPTESLLAAAGIGFVLSKVFK